MRSARLSLLAGLLLGAGGALRVAVVARQGSALDPERAVHLAATASDGEGLLVLGGRDAEGFAAEGMTARAFRVEPATGAVEALPDLEAPLAGAAAAVLDGYVYLAGGRVPWESPWIEGIARESSSAVLAALSGEGWTSEDPDYGRQVLALAWRLDLADPAAGWERLPPMFVPREGHRLVAWQGRLVALGGRYLHDPAEPDLPLGDLQACEDGVCHLAFSECLAPGEAAWTPCTEWNLTYPRYQAGVAPLGDGYMVAGGACAPDGDAGCADDGEWIRADGSGEAIPSLPVEVPRLTGAALDGMPVFLAEADADDGTGLLAYDPSSRRWAFDPLPFEVSEAAVQAANGRLWLASGRFGSLGADLPALVELDVHLLPDLGPACAGFVRGAGAPEDGWLSTCDDGDGDGFGSDPSGCAFAEPDCDDGAARAWPGAAELCGDGLDDDCDGQADEPEALDASRWCLDADGDGYGLDSDCVPACAAPSGRVAAGGEPDCDDGDPAVHPGAIEQCDGVDDDCDGAIDPEEEDGDGDGWSTCEGDCDDAEPLVHRGLEETCGDDLDNDCDGAEPEACGGLGDMALDAADAVFLGTGEYDGGAVVGAGDLDGDGFADLALGAPGDGTAGVHAGAVHVFLGPFSGAVAPAQADGLLLGPFADEVADEGALVGSVLDGGSDGDGDGLSDLLIGGYGGQPERYRAGEVYLVRGPALGTVSLADAHATILGEDMQEYAAVGTWAGDLDGDGQNDVAVGARGWGATAAGAVFLFHGALSGTLTLSDADAALTGTADVQMAGSGLAGNGDADGDGYEDLAVGAMTDSTTAAQAGAVFLVRGPVTASLSLADATAKALGEWSGSRLGRFGSFDFAGDVDGDGRDDLALGSGDYSWNDIGDHGSAGTTYLMLGPLSGTVDLRDATYSLKLDPRGDPYGGSGLFFGWQVSGAGDLDGDGFGDVAVGAPGYHELAESAGGAWVFQDLEDEPSVQAHELGQVPDARSLGTVLSGTLAGQWAGGNLAGAGDTDADGFDDLLVGCGYGTVLASCTPWLVLGGAGL